MKPLLFSLLLAFSAAAQPVAGPEVRSAAIPTTGDVALLPQGSGFLVAWSEADRINVGHLDATLHATDAPFSILLPAPSALPTFVTLASNGSSILVVWKEKPPYGHADSTYAATLTADAKAILAPPEFLNATPCRPAAGTRGGRYIVISGDESVILTERLETDALKAISPSLSGASNAVGELATVSAAVDQHCSRSGVCCFPRCTTTKTFTFTTPSVSKSIALVFGLIVPQVQDPIVAPDGDHFVALFPKSGETSVFELRGDQPAAAWTLDPVPPPGIITAAGNGSDVLVVWWSPPAINGIVLHADHAPSEPFVIAQYADYDSARVFAASSNEFVVTYRYTLDGEHSVIAGRFVRLQPAWRQRAVH